MCLLCPGGTGGLSFSGLEKCLRKIWIITYFSHIILSMQLYLTFFHWQNVTATKAGTSRVFRPYQVQWNGIYWLISLVLLFWIEAHVRKGEKKIHPNSSILADLISFALCQFSSCTEHSQDLKTCGRIFLIKNRKVQLKSTTLNKWYIITYTAGLLL